MSPLYQALITAATFVIGVPIGWKVANKVGKRRRTPRILVATEIIPVGDQHNGPPKGLDYVINDLRVREGDVVFLTRQPNSSINGFWEAGIKSWRRITSGVTLVPSNGSWVLAHKGKEKKPVKRRSRYERNWVI